MTMKDRADQAIGTEGRGLRRRSVRITALAVSAGLIVSAVATAGGGAAGASTPVSQSEGRFLTGSVSGTSFDTVAALEGEMAQYPDNPGANQNNLSGSVLGQALSSPLGNISVPFPGGVTFGAVGQYAKANSDGSAVGSSGLIGSNGGINIAGSGNSDLATIDLANLPGASSLTSLLGDLKLTVGAVSGRAEQAAFGKTLADPSANCTGGTYKRVSDTDQAGSYQFANLTIGATSPLLSSLGSSLSTTLSTLIAQFSDLAGALPGGVVTISGAPTAAQLESDFTVSLAGGGITADLATGSLTIDLAKILTAAGLDINNLCPNTSLVPYLADALADLPSKLGSLVTGLTTTLTNALDATTIKIAGTPLSAGALTNLINSVLSPSGGTSLTSTLSSVTSALSSALTPAVNALSNDLLDLTGNAQTESSGTFTEAALLLSLIPNGGSLPTVPGLPTFSTILPSAAARFGHTSSTATLTAARLAAPWAAAVTASPVLQLNLGLAAVTNNAPTSTTTTTSTPSSSVPTTAIPTGVPAGLASHHDNGSPLTPIALLVVGLVLAAGTTFTLRRRGKFVR